jgi:hypothetical protein
LAWDITMTGWIRHLRRKMDISKNLEAVEM